MSDVIVFGYVARDASDAARERMTRLAVVVAQLAGVELAMCRAGSYSELTELVQKQKLDVAWLPPVPYMALSRHGQVEPLVSLVRGGHSVFYSVLIAREDGGISNPRELGGKRAAWVDRRSASGYVLPRIGLMAVGIDPRKAFSSEQFLGSHPDVVRAVIDGTADFGATYAGADASGTLTRGGWSTVPDAKKSLRVLATFGAIPADVIVARADLGAHACECITRGLVLASKEEAHRPLLDEVFGPAEFRRGAPAGYDEFCAATMQASAEGLLEGEEKIARG